MCCRASRTGSLCRQGNRVKASEGGGLAENDGGGGGGLEGEAPAWQEGHAGQAGQGAPTGCNMEAAVLKVDAVLLRIFARETNHVLLASGKAGQAGQAAWAGMARRVKASDGVGFADCEGLRWRRHLAAWAGRARRVWASEGGGLAGDDGGGGGGLEGGALAGQAGQAG